MKRTKIAAVFFFICGVVAAVTTDSVAFPAFLRVAKKFGAKDCRFCHVKLEGGEPFAERGNWLIAERKRRGADVADPEWLVDYKPGVAPAKKGDEKKVDKNPLEQELMKLEVEWTEAVKNHDSAKLERFLLDDFISTDESGKTVSKRDFMQAAADVAINSYSYDEVLVRSYSDTAVVSALWDVKGSYKGNDFTGKYRETDVWVKKSGKWQVAATHISRVPEK